MGGFVYNPNSYTPGPFYSHGIVIGSLSLGVGMAKTPSH